MDRILAARDIASRYRVLKVEGVTQQTIAALTGQSQSEVTEILKGPRVRDVTVLEWICDGLGVPRELMASPTASPTPTVQTARSLTLPQGGHGDVASSPDRAG